MTRVGRCTCCTRFATVNVFPLPVTPSSACWRSPRFTPATSSSIARGWSPCGLYSLTSLNGMAHECNRRSSPALSRRFSMRQTIACTLAVFLVSSSGWSQTKTPAPTPADPRRPAQVTDGPAKPVVRLIATGGTIAMKIDPVKKAPAPAISREDLVATVPEIAQVERGAGGKGAMVALNNDINGAREAVKTHTSDVATFKSGDLGFLGFAEYDRIVWYRTPIRRQHVALRALGEGQHLPRVDIVDSY